MTDKRLLTDEEIEEIYPISEAMPAKWEDYIELIKNIAQAQLAKADKAHQQEIEEIFRELESHPSLIDYDTRMVDCPWYKDLKSRKGEK